MTKNAETGRLGWLQRLASPLVSPTFYYVVGFLFAVGLLLVLYNPTFGAASKAWPHEMLGLGDAPFAWHRDAATVLALGLLGLAYLVALCMRSGPARATLVLLASLFAFLTVETLEGGAPFTLFFVGPALLAALTGVLLTRHGEGEGRRYVLLVLTSLVLGAWLFLPWEAARIVPQGHATEYRSTATETVMSYVESADRGIAEADPHALGMPGDGFCSRAFELLVPTAACLLFLAGLLTLLGLGGGWARWFSGTLLLFVVIGTAVVLYLQGCDGARPGGLDAWQLGLNRWAGTWHLNYVAYALPLAGAVAEFVRGRRP